MLDLFGGINTSLATVFQAGILVQKYFYVERYETARRVSSCHFTLLMRQYPALLGAQDLVKVGPIDLVIVGWPSQGHTRAGCGEGLRDPQSRMFWEML
jgi:site-specific DNA-cytosine methylase